MSRQVSTVVSDLALALSAIWSFKELSGSRFEEKFQYGKWWFMLQAIAASVGVINFGRLLESKQATIEKYHRNFTWLCQAIGIPCLAAQICRKYGFSFMSQVFLWSCIVNVFSSYSTHLQKVKCVEIVSVFSVITMLCIGLTRHNSYLTGGCLLLIIGSLIGAEGRLTFLDMARVDVFHYILIAFNFCLVWGLV